MLISARPTVNYTGCDDLRAWLGGQGFKFAIDPLHHELNSCNWYAYRPTVLAARECECNDGKTLQITVHPSLFMARGMPDVESAEVEVCGEAGGAWFKLRAYSLRGLEIRERFAEIEARLIDAWNAILPGKAA